ncbi:unnamed protein product [Heligmosomoides polygyrus]|uniref:Reverse transcriptase domain-containing protein n=1 Tax=Heligmosomoides polygyrus TaxID=6339 RepID=A0A183G837_HELPZ|nr:unnamed protein product [Heligmosomoides polygyrus]
MHQELGEWDNKYDEVQSIIRKMEINRQQLQERIKDSQQKETAAKWSGNYFSQRRGLAMGQRLAPTLAICFMSKIERPALERLPIMYCRYIDGCCIITASQSDMDELFAILNTQSQYIKFTRETPSEARLNGYEPRREVIEYDTAMLNICAKSKFVFNCPSSLMASRQKCAAAYCEQT